MSRFQDPEGLFRQRLLAPVGHHPLKLPGDISTPETELQRAADVRQLLVGKEEALPPEQQKWSPSLDQKDAKHPQIKEEEEELWSSQEGEQFQGRGEDDISKFIFDPVSVKSEGDEEELQSSQFQQRPTELMETGADGSDCGGSEPARDFDPERHFQAESDNKSEPGPDKSGDCNWTKKYQSGLNSVGNIKYISPKIDLKLHSCSQCGKAYKKKQKLTTHMVIHTGVKPFSCSECGTRFISKENMITHMRIHTGEKQFSCPHCGKTFNNKGNLTRHMRIHTEEKDFSCPECGKRFNIKANMIRHMRTHTGEKTLSCPDCGKRFTQKGHLDIHMRTHTGEKPFSCSECGKRFNQKGSLNIHMRIHTGEKPFSCPDCGKKFNQKGYFYIHIRNHKGVKTYSCSECEKRFVQKSSLTRHFMAHHSKEKPFGCPECCKRFNFRGNLTKHLRTHTGEKCYTCSECGKGFSQNENLTTHLRIHTGEKPYCCSECGEKFIRMSRLTAHMARHSGEKPFSCSEFGFSSPYQIKFHECVGIRVSELNQNQAQDLKAAETRAEGEDCGQEQVRNLNPERHLQQVAEMKTEEFLEVKTEDTDKDLFMIQI